MQDQTSSLDGSGAVFVSPTSTAVLHNCRPLPEDIISLDDSETACQYCGVSYLLLSKYDKMRTHVSKLEADLASLKSYAQLHPALTERAAWLENNLKSARAENEIMKDELASAAEDSGKTIRALHELQLRHTHLTHDYEELLKSEMVVNKLCTSQRRLALEGLIHIKNTLRELHLSLGKMMSALKIESKSILESTVRNLAQALLSHLQLFIDRQVDYRTSALRAKHSLELSQISEELQDAKAELNFCEQKNDHLRKDLEALQEMHDEYAQAHKGKAEDYGKQMVDLESQLATKNSELDEARDSMKELEEQEAALKKRLLELSNLVDQQSKELFQKDQDILETESQLAEERKKFDALQVSMYRASSRSKNEADVKIMNLSNENRRLQDELSKMLSERQKMIDAHQSRLGQLQNKYAEMMREASKGQKPSIRSRKRWRTKKYSFWQHKNLFFKCNCLRFKPNCRHRSTLFVSRGIRVLRNFREKFGPWRKTIRANLTPCNKKLKP
ncbi:hypothetical protein DFJ73DRAFT_45646 [Zopfochytrium polystomum]|nr:hypothetical protein DFJ73DRAFT_45646 [Zopfochytrium polystomum]